MKLDLQKASIYKRLSAFLFDFIMLGILIVGVGFILSSFMNYDTYLDSLNETKQQYERDYGIKFETTYEEYLKLSPEEQKKFDDANLALQNDKAANANYSMLINLTLVIISLSTLVAYLIWEFVIPLILKNGQTLGKKIFGIGVMHTSCIEITPMLLFIRTVLGKYTLETMVPLLIVMMIFLGNIGLIGTIVLLGILVLQIVLMCATHTNSLLHDILAQTVVIDLQSQMIFKDGAALIAYKEQMHMEEVAKRKY